MMPNIGLWDWQLVLMDHFTFPIPLKEQFGASSIQEIKLFLKIPSFIPMAGFIFFKEILPLIRKTFDESVNATIAIFH